jgi:hypothetical protein
LRDRLRVVVTSGILVYTKKLTVAFRKQCRRIQTPPNDRLPHFSSFAKHKGKN